MVDPSIAPDLNRDLDPLRKLTWTIAGDKYECVPYYDRVAMDSN